MSKVIRQAALIIFLLLAVTLNAFALNKNDFTALKYGKIADAGTNIIIVSGKGFLGITTTQGPDAASAVIYNNPINPRNFEANLTFIKDYGQGEGVQAGWYAINFSKTKNWFSSAKDVVKQSNISGVTIIFKLNPNDKKTLTLELNRYTPGSGFTNLVGSSIIVTMQKDWQCNVKITNGKLVIDNQDVLDLNDAFDLTIGEKGYVGFGGFSENHYDIEMKVEYQGVSQPNPTNQVPTTKKQDAPPAATSANTTKPNSTSGVTSATTGLNSTGNDTPETTETEPDSTIVDTTNPAATTEAEDTTDTENSQVGGGTEDEKGGFNPLLIVLAVAVLIVAGAVAFFMVKVRKKGGN